MRCFLLKHCLLLLLFIVQNTTENYTSKDCGVFGDKTKCIVDTIRFGREITKICKDTTTSHFSSYIATNDHKTTTAYRFKPKRYVRPLRTTLRSVTIYDKLKNLSGICIIFSNFDNFKIDIRDKMS